jgi:hypothetical protein
VGCKGWGSEKLRATFDEIMQRPWPSHAQHYEIGTILEIHRDESDTIMPRFEAFTTKDFLAEFPRSSIAYIGPTPYEAAQIIALGKVPPLSILWQF